MTSITNQWVKVRGFDERIVKGMSFESARVLIVTETMELIDGHVNFVLGNHMVLVRVREVQPCPSAPCSLVSSTEAAMTVEFPSSGVDDSVFEMPIVIRTHVRNLEA